VKLLGFDTLGPHRYDLSLLGFCWQKPVSARHEV